MKKLALVISSITPILFLVVPMASADTTVVNNVSSSANGGNATSNVSVTNSGSTNSSSSVTSTSHTSIHTESNGQTYDYESDQPGSVSVQNNNGSVTVNGKQVQGVSTNNTTPAPTIDAEQQKKFLQEKIDAMKAQNASRQAELQKKTAAMAEAHKNFFQRFIDSLKKFFHFS